MRTESKSAQVFKWVKASFQEQLGGTLPILGGNPVAAQSQGSPTMQPGRQQDQVPAFGSLCLPGASAGGFCVLLPLRCCFCMVYLEQFSYYSFEHFGIRI